MLETKIIKETKNLINLKWSKIRNSSGTAGSFLKAYSELGGKKLYYKLSNYDNINGVVGFESVNEIIVDRLLTILGVEHVHYQLIKAKIKVDEREWETFLCVSEDFKNQNEDKTALDNYYDVEHKEGEDRLSFCINRGWEDFVYKMFVIDYLILNRDRHGANIEVLRDKKKHTIRLAPLFDHGLSLLFNINKEKDIANFDVLEDKKVNSYLGGNSVRDNLELIIKGKEPKFNCLKESDRGTIFEDLEGVISQSMMDKIWEMIYKRWSFYENFCNTRI